MTTYDIVKSVDLAIRRSLTDWQEGRSTSPDERDYLIVADEIMRKEDSSYTPLGEIGDYEVFTELAGELFELGDKLASTRELAEWCVDKLRDASNNKEVESR